MKKIITVIIAIALLFCVSTTAFAAETTILKATELSAYVYSTFEVTIPAKVDLKATNGIINVSVDSLNLDPDKKLGLFLENSSMQRTDGTTAKLELYVDGELKDNVIASFLEPGNVVINAKLKDDAPAGSYSGYVNFSVFTFTE